MNLPDDVEEGNAFDPEEPSPTRSELTRAATVVNQLGVQITKLSSTDLDRLELSERLRREVDVCQRLKPRSRGRQNRLIGQLLRAEDHKAIRERIDALKGGYRDAVHREKIAEQWLIRLVDEGDSAVEALIADDPQADRQRLRLLVRTARKDPEARKAKRARRELLRAIRELRE